MKKPLLLCLSLLPSLAVAAALPIDSIRLTERLYQRVIATPLLETEYTANVPLHHLTHTSSLSSFGIHHQWRGEHQAIMEEKGSGTNSFQAFASTYLQLSPKEHLWGFAQYDNGVRRGVNWNTTSDYALLYPYVVSDQVGGDLLHERYSFGGGYSGLWQSLRLAGELRYAAQQEYRTRDPRPRNVTSHLVTSMGMALPIGPQVVAAGLGYEIYKQRSNVSFFSPSGTTIQRLMNGLGNSFVRFDDNTPTLYYRLHTIYTSLHIIPHGSSTGLFASAAYRYSQLTQILSDINDAPIHHYQAHQVVGAIGYQKIKRHGLTYSVALKSDVSVCNGIEHIIGEPMGGTYPIVGYLHNFRMLNSLSQLSLTLSRDTLLHWYTRATIEHQLLSVVKLVPEKRLINSHIQPSLSGGVAWKLSPQQILALDSKIGYTPSSKRTLELPLASMEEQQVAHLTHLSSLLSSSSIQIQAAPSYSILFGKGSNEWGIQMACLYRYCRYHLERGTTLDSHQIQTTIRVVF